MSKIYALMGCHDTGKTTTLKLVHDILIKEKKGQVIFFREHKGDICVVVAVYGKKIGIVSMGDYEDLLNEFLKMAEDVGCDIIFCACRARGQTNDCVLEHDPNALFFEKTREKNRLMWDKRNKEMTRKLISEIGL